MPAFKSRFDRSRSVLERVAERVVDVTGRTCMSLLCWYEASVTSRATDEDLAGLLADSDTAGELALTCELLFLRFGERAVAVGHVDRRRVDRLIQQLPEGRYAVVDRYACRDPGARGAEGDVQYTISLYGALYLAADGFDRAGMRLSFGVRGGNRVSSQAFTRRGDSLADALRADPAVNLLRACRCIEYRTAAVPDSPLVTRLLEAEEPLPCNVAT